MTNSLNRRIGVLDCESLDSTYDSIQSIFGLTREAIDRVFASLDVERFYAENRDYPHDAPHLLMEKIKFESSSQIKFDAVCWFHLSRVLSPNTFENGILPLGGQVDAIWESLRSLVGARVSDDDWSDFRNNLGNSHSASLYHMKVNDRDHWGPYGVLVREVAFCPVEVGNHDYLDVPEIVEGALRNGTISIFFLRSFRTPSLVSLSSLMSSRIRGVFRRRCTICITGFAESLCPFGAIPASTVVAKPYLPRKSKKWSSRIIRRGNTRCSRSG